MSTQLWKYLFMTVQEFDDRHVYGDNVRGRASDFREPSKDFNTVDNTGFEFSLNHPSQVSLIKSLAFSPIIKANAPVCPEGGWGIIPTSATRKLSNPCTRNV